MKNPDKSREEIYALFFFISPSLISFWIWIWLEYGCLRVSVSQNDFTLCSKQRYPWIIGINKCLLFNFHFEKISSLFHDLLMCAGQERVVSSHWAQEWAGQIDTSLSEHNLYLLKKKKMIKNPVKFACIYFQEMSWVHTQKFLKTLIIICEVVHSNIRVYQGNNILICFPRISFKN